MQGREGVLGVREDPRLVMAIKVRNEADVIEANLRHHLAHGVDFFVVTDNGSDDGTREILQRWQDAGLMEVFDEPHEDFWSRAHGWVTRMARVAAERHAADWVLHADADEFWVAPAGSLKAALGSVPDRYQVVLAPRPEFLPRPDGEEPFYERMTARERYSRLRPKVAHRGIPGVALHQGAHDVMLVNKKVATSVLNDRRALTRLADPGRRGFDPSPAWAPYWPVRVLHFPIRSYEQYRRRVETVVFRGDPPATETRKDLRRRLKHGRLERSYEKLVLPRVPDRAPDRVAGSWSSIRACATRCAPAPTASPRPAPGMPWPPGSAGLDGEQLAAELAEIEYDAMQSIARSQRMLLRRVDRLQEQSRKNKARVRLERHAGREAAAAAAAQALMASGWLRAVAAAAIVVAWVALAGCGSRRGTDAATAPDSSLPASAPAGRQRPNIVLIVTDDQTVESMRIMSRVNRLVGDRGAEFGTSYVNFPLCCTVPGDGADRPVRAQQSRARQQGPDWWLREVPGRARRLESGHVAAGRRVPHRARRQVRERLRRRRSELPAGRLGRVVRERRRRRSGCTTID